MEHYVLSIGNLQAHGQKNKQHSEARIATFYKKERICSQTQDLEFERQRIDFNGPSVIQLKAPKFLFDEKKEKMRHHLTQHISRKVIRSHHVTLLSFYKLSK